MAQLPTTTTAAVPAMNTGGKIMAIIPQSWSEIVSMAAAIVRAGMAPKHYEGSVEKASVAIMAGLEVGLAPLAALQGIYVINNTPTLYGDALLALVRGSGLLEDISEEQIEDEAGVPTLARCRVKRRGQASWAEQEITQVQAKKAGWWGKSGPWTATPKRMMQMRARGWVLRDTFADVLKGIKPAEEMEDMLDVTAHGEAITSPPPPPQRSDFVETPSETKAADPAVTQDRPPPVGANAESKSASTSEGMPQKSWAVNLPEGADGDGARLRAILQLLDEMATTEVDVDALAKTHGRFLKALPTVMRDEAEAHFKMRRQEIRQAAERKP